MTAFWDTVLCSPYDGGQYAPLKRRSTSTRLHGPTSQKAVIFIRSRENLKSHDPNVLTDTFLPFYSFGCSFLPYKIFSTTSWMKNRLIARPPVVISTQDNTEKHIHDPKRFRTRDTGVQLVKTARNRPQAKLHGNRQIQCDSLSL
jgi:hypothetical protein